MQRNACTRSYSPLTGRWIHVKLLKIEEKAGTSNKEEWRIAWNTHGRRRVTQIPVVTGGLRECCYLAQTSLCQGAEQDRTGCGLICSQPRSVWLSANESKQYIATDLHLVEASPIRKPSTELQPYYRVALAAVNHG